MQRDVLVAWVITAGCIYIIIVLWWMYVVWREPVGPGPGAVCRAPFKYDKAWFAAGVHVTHDF